jgi:plasmid stabilization system protein ParE
MKIVWSPLAMERAGEIVSHIALDNPKAAEKLISLVFQKVKRLSQFPQSGRWVPETNRRDIREIIHGSYRIIYRMGSDHIAILTIRHGKQLLPRTDIL